MLVTNLSEIRVSLGGKSQFYYFLVNNGQKFKFSVLLTFTTLFQFNSAHLRDTNALQTGYAYRNNQQSIQCEEKRQSREEGQHCWSGAQKRGAEGYSEGLNNFIPEFIQADKKYSIKLLIQMGLPCYKLYFGVNHQPLGHLEEQNITRVRNFNQNKYLSYIIISTMEAIFQKLELKKDLKEQLRIWCRQNGIKISFTVSMTLTKSKTIFRKLQNTYKKGCGKVKTRWLQNELKLFHFAVLSVSVLYQMKISQFDKEQWEILEQAFPSKPQPILEYESKNFTINKNILKNKWEENQDNYLIKIISSKNQQIKWNQIAIQLYIDSDRRFFRNGKQCRERWLNHLDTAIKHDKWTDQEDQILMKGVKQYGKKWSRIMKCFDNQRTQHMIKNRFLSLILRCRKSFPYIQDEESAINLIFKQMGIQCQEINIQSNQLYGERKLRTKNNPDNLSEDEANENQSEDEDAQLSENEDHILTQNQVFQTYQPYVSNQVECMKMGALATPTTNFMSPSYPFIAINPYFPGFGVYQTNSNNFFNQMSTNFGFFLPQ